MEVRPHKKVGPGQLCERSGPNPIKGEFLGVGSAGCPRRDDMSY